MLLLLLLATLSVARAQSTVDTLQSDIAAAYVPCTESVHCSSIYQLNEDIADEQKRYFYTSEFNNSLILWQNDSLMNPFTFLTPTPTDNDYVWWAVGVRSSQPPYCAVEGETLVWLGDAQMPVCECLQGLCEAGPFNASLIYTMLLLLVFAVLVHIVLDILMLLKTKGALQKTSDVDLTPSDRKRMQISSIGLKRRSNNYY